MDVKSVGAAGRDYSEITAENLLKIQQHMIRAHAGCAYQRPCKLHDRDLRAITHELWRRGHDTLT